MSRLVTMNKKRFNYKTDEWITPQKFFDKLNGEFHFTLDVAATSTNNKCERYFTKEEDGLKQDWSNETVWCNPPYGGRGTIEAWVKKAYNESKKGVTSVLLLPVRTDVSYWHDYCMKGEIRFIRGRLKFENSYTNNSAPFASAIVIFKGGVKNV
ncbi:MAG: DNA N-6-adenine-methyltransferase (Dam) [Candidatus Methanofastidiosum methylothiophilum]|uniref:DNA N-6-adenine-methyltransferase (Dam) n=1 Tax=Candidatus Methanofastidiosum methylothiophilum TaxID=1705564 RepID=A0A150J984_9EURY|nr:MAG: DNA N-6-adenine-methyltransferase (Dam) [Candidatus Methanofastidiosum methylthiophilus]